MTKFNRTITIRIRPNKAGKPVAHYWGQAKRWLAMGVAEAELALATGEFHGCHAVAVETTSDPLPAGYKHTSAEGDVTSI
jgi:hypothetical protein